MVLFFAVMAEEPELVIKMSSTYMRRYMMYVDV